MTMKFEQAVFNDFETAIKETRFISFKFLSLASEGYVIVTKAILSTEEEILAFKDPKIRDQINELLLIQHKNFLDLAATDFLANYSSNKDTPEFIAKWFSDERYGVGIGHLFEPTLIKNWQEAEQEMDLDSVAIIEELVEKNKLEPLEDQDIQRMGVEAYNGGLLVGWRRHQKMVDLEKKLELHKQRQEKKATQDTKKEE